jgi:hypothetical protein
MGSWLSSPEPEPTVHEPGYFHNIKLNDCSIRELRSLRVKVETALLEHKGYTDEQILVELAPLDTEIKKRETLPIVQ